MEEVEVEHHIVRQGQEHTVEVMVDILLEEVEVVQVQQTLAVEEEEDLDKHQDMQAVQVSS